MWGHFTKFTEKCYTAHADSSITVLTAFIYRSPATWNLIPASLKIVPPYTTSSATSTLTS